MEQNEGMKLAGYLRVHSDEEHNVVCIQIQCPLCEQWCNAVTEGEPVDLITGPSDSASQMHMRIRLHVHDHDCVLARDIAAEFLGYLGFGHPTP